MEDLVDIVDFNNRRGLMGKIGIREEFVFLRARCALLGAMDVFPEFNGIEEGKVGGGTVRGILEEILGKILGEILGEIVDVVEVSERLTAVAAGILAVEIGVFINSTSYFLGELDIFLTLARRSAIFYYKGMYLKKIKQLLFLRIA